MTRLDKILYLADMTSAERDWPGVEKLRKLEKKESGCRYAGRAEADQRFCALAGQAPLRAGHIGQIQNFVKPGHAGFARRVAGNSAKHRFVGHTPLGAGQNGGAHAVPHRGRALFADLGIQMCIRDSVRVDDVAQRLGHLHDGVA